MYRTKHLVSLASLLFACAAPAGAADPSPSAMFRELAALADTGNADVKYNLGMFHNNGIGTPRDPRTAYRYFSEAAEAGNLLAAYKVGCYHAGQFAGVVPVDQEAAFGYKLRAAQAGYDLAQHDVGIHLGRKGDLAGALVWWERASRQGVMGSTAYLAHHFSRGAVQDKVKAVALMLVLKEQLPETPKELADQLAASQAALSEDERVQAERMRASWSSGPTPLTLAARTGVSSIPGLIASLKQ